MNRPPFEVADIIRAHGNSFVEKGRSWVTWLHLRVLFAIDTAALRRSAAIWTAAANAAMKPSPSTPAAPGTVPSAKPTLATSGSPDAVRNCCRSTTYMSSLRSPIGLLKCLAGTLAAQDAR